MPRNLDNRVELAVPIEDPALRAEVLEAVELCLADNHNAWDLDADGVWTRREAPSSEATVNAQEQLMRAPHARAPPTATGPERRRPRGSCLSDASPAPGSETTFGGWLPSRVLVPY